MTHLTDFKAAWIILFAAAIAPQLSAMQPGSLKPQTLPELKNAIRQVLEETGTPAAGIALVNPDGSFWTGSLGMADAEIGIPANEETMFRIGSTSKVFVALAILKLQEQGMLTLKDRIKDLIPEIEYHNAWEDTYPVLVEHLLEHTTGWPDLHLIEYEQADNKLLSLKEALDFHPHSRVSRWIPGTRMAYSNIGPNVAAYIVEKVAGVPYEDFIKENFFRPMGMETATYRLSEDYRQKGATLYREGAPSAYVHMLMRASGSINASPLDMLRLLQLMINRGKTGSSPLISERSIKRMETPSTTSGARAGLAFGYGLGLYTSPHNGFTYYKHGGGVGNGSCDFSYLPEYGVGYSIMINSNNPGGSIWKIAGLIRDFQTQDLPVATTNPLKTAKTLQPIDGYFQVINPVSDFADFPPLTAKRFWTEGDTLYTQEPAFTGETERFIAATDNLFQSVVTKRAELILVNDPLAGKVFELANDRSGTITYGSVSASMLVSKYLIIILWILLVVRSLLVFPVGAYRYLRRKIPGGRNIWIRIWPILPPLFLIVSFGLLAAGSMESIRPLAKPSVYSIGIMCSTIGFFVTAICSLVAPVIYKKDVARSVYIPALVLGVLHTLVAFYLLFHGLIGIRTWA